MRARHLVIPLALISLAALTAGSCRSAARPKVVFPADDSVVDRCPADERHLLPIKPPYGVLIGPSLVTMPQVANRPARPIFARLVGHTETDR